MATGKGRSGRSGGSGRRSGPGQGGSGPRSGAGRGRGGSSGRRSGPRQGSASGQGGGPKQGQGRTQGRAQGGRGQGQRGTERNVDDAGRPRPKGRRSRRSARGLGGDQVEGRQAVRELLLAGTRRVDEVLMIDDLAGADVLADIEELAQELGVSVRRVSRRHLAAEALTESHQGVIARAAALDPVDFDELTADPAAFLLVLDGVTDPGNLGAILRTAECAGVSGVVLGRHRSVHVTPTVTKTAAGAVEHVPLSLVAGIPSAIATLNDRGFVTVGLDGGGDRSIFELGAGPTGPIALVMGAEGVGLSRLVRERVEVLASIPLAGELNSLNVAAATAVACFEVVRTRDREPG
ncbi:MAG: 23S rRNA (guanosine(2251)-2'-O)-methyltransferase RlmB [Actinomycetota bacterium]